MKIHLRDFDNPDWTVCGYEIRQRSEPYELQSTVDEMNVTEKDSQITCKKCLAKIHVPEDLKPLTLLEAFLRDLTEVSRKHGIIIGGCGCHGSPFLGYMNDEQEFFELSSKGSYIVEDEGLPHPEVNVGLNLKWKIKS